MSPARAAQLFLRRMVCLRLANLCPFASGRVWLYRCMGARIGRDVYIGFGVELDTDHPELITIGDHVTISHRCTLVSHMATTADTPLRTLYPDRASPVRIERGAWICAGAMLLPGVTIGENALVAAGGGREPGRTREHARGRRARSRRPLAPPRRRDRRASPCRNSLSCSGRRWRPPCAGRSRPGAPGTRSRSSSPAWRRAASGSGSCGPARPGRTRSRSRTGWRRCRWLPTEGRRNGRSAWCSRSRAGRASPARRCASGAREPSNGGWTPASGSGGSSRNATWWAGSGRSPPTCRSSTTRGSPIDSRPRRSGSSARRRPKPRTPSRFPGCRSTTSSRAYERCAAPSRAELRCGGSAPGPATPRRPSPSRTTSTALGSWTGSAPRCWRRSWPARPRRGCGAPGT
jgi:hypothetical protein